MKKQKKQNTNKGITLIALVITIIVMLILVAVTITMAVNGGLFEYAGRAGTKTNQAVANEQEFANLEANMAVNDLIDKYTNFQSEKEEIIMITFSITNFGTHTVQSGKTWREWIAENETIWEVLPDNSVFTYDVDVGNCWIHYEGNRVDADSPIQDGYTYLPWG